MEHHQGQHQSVQPPGLRLKEKHPQKPLSLSRLCSAIRDKSHVLIEFRLRIEGNAPDTGYVVGKRRIAQIDDAVGVGFRDTEIPVGEMPEATQIGGLSAL